MIPTCLAPSAKFTLAQAELAGQCNGTLKIQVNPIQVHDQMSHPVGQEAHIFGIAHNLSSSDASTRSDLGGERERYRVELPSFDRDLLPLDLAD